MAGSNGAKVASDPAAGSDGKRSVIQSVADAVPDATKRALQDKAERLRSQSREAAAAAGEQLETARTYVVERVQERPFTTTLAALGAGILLGLLFAGRRR